MLGSSVLLKASRWPPKPGRARLRRAVANREGIRSIVLTNCNEVCCVAADLRQPTGGEPITLVLAQTVAGGIVILNFGIRVKTRRPESSTPKYAPSATAHGVEMTWRLL